MSTAAHFSPARLGALRLPPFLSGLAAERARRAPRGWPAWLPAPANRPDELAFVETMPGEPDGVAPFAGNAAPAGGWFDSSLDLRLGLEVVDLGPVEWLDESDGAFA